MNMHSSIVAARAANRREWESALADYRRADASLEAADAVHLNAEDAWFAYRRSIEPEGLIDFGWCPRNRQLSDTPLDQIVGLYEPPFVRPGKYDGEAMRRSIEEYRERCDQAYQRFGLNASQPAFDFACEARRACFEELIGTPAPDVAALAFKIELLREFDCDEAFIDALVADARRLAGKSLDRA